MGWVLKFFLNPALRERRDFYSNFQEENFAALNANNIFFSALLILVYFLSVMQLTICVL